MKILGVYTDWATNQYRIDNNAFGAVTYYRIFKPLLASGHEVELCGKTDKFGKEPEEVWKNVFENYDCVFMKMADSPIAVNAVLALAEHYGKPVIVDLDDNHLCANPGTPAYDVYKEGAVGRYIVNAQVSLANHLVVSTDPLKESYTPLRLIERQDPLITVLPNCNDVNDWKFTPKKYTDGKIRIGYMGSITHNSDFALIIEPLKKVLQKYLNVEFEIFGAMTKETLQMFKKRFRSVRGKLKTIYGTPSWEGYPELMSTMGWDIGIAPLEDNEFNRCKSHIKWMEYAMYQIPTVASKVYPYYQDIQGVKTIQHGKTGLLASTDQEWIDSLSLLIENKEEREKLGRNAYDYIYQNWQWDSHIHKWNTFFKQIK